MHLLFVCTGNICRSPTAERLTLAYAKAQLAGPAESLTVCSAGTAALVGYPMDSSAGLVLTGLGGSAEGFRARQLLVEDIHPADLVLTMTRRQRASVLQLAPRMLSRTFTLREAAALLPAVDVGGIVVESDFTHRGRRLVAALAQHRPARGMDRAGVGDDIADPIGRDLQIYQRVGDAIARALLPLLEVLSANGRSSAERNLG